LVGDALAGLFIKNKKNYRMKKIFNRNNILYYLIFAAFVALTLYLGSILNIWEDEICSLKSTDKDASYAFNQALKFEGQPPVYFMLLNFWRKIDNGILFSRSFSLISILISAFIFLKLIKLHVPKVNKHVALIIFLFNPVIVWAATEVRHYAFSVMLSLLLLWFFTNGFLIENEKKKKYRLFYYIIAFLSLYTFYYFSFLLLANGVFLLIRKKWKDFLFYCINMAVILIPIFFLYSIIHEEIIMHDQTLYQANTFIGRSLEIVMGLQNYLFSMFLLPFNESGKIILKIFILAVLIIGFFKLRKKEMIQSLKSDNISVSLITQLLVILAMYLTVLLVFPKLYFTDRYLVILFPILTIISIKFIWDFMSTLYLKRVLLSGFIILFFIGNLFYFRVPVKKFDYIMAAEYLSKNVKDSKPILFYRSVLGPIFKYYYKGNSKLYDLPDSAGYTTNFLDKLNSEQQFDSILKKIGGQQFWLVADDQIQYKYSVDYNRNMLYNYMNKRGAVIKDTIFYGRANFFYFRITEFRVDTAIHHKL
jgi:uncharacterized membrane protein